MVILVVALFVVVEDWGRFVIVHIIMPFMNQGYIDLLSLDLARTEKYATEGYKHKNSEREPLHVVLIKANLLIVNIDCAYASKVSKPAYLAKFVIVRL